MVKIAFSWDDGSVEDLKLMDLSMSYGIPGIFFIPGSNKERAMLNELSIKDVASNNFEIGSHTMSHTYLTEIPVADAEREMLHGKDYLEQLLGKEIPHFCFPGGKYNDELVRIAGKYFATARTADTCAIIKNASFLVKPAFHFFDRGKKSLLYNCIKNKSPILNFLTSRLLRNEYFSIISGLVDDLNNSVKLYRIIIWGHSWEIEENGLWSKLEELFRHLNTSHPDSVSKYSDLLNCRAE